MQATRPDIVYLINILSQFIVDPTQHNLDALLCVLSYLKDSPGQGIFLPRYGGNDLVANSDSDWPGCPMKRCSRTGYLLLLVGAPISWNAKKQSVVS